MDRCMRCNRPLSNPHSIARSLGPVCYQKAGGGVFDADMQADEKEWVRREELLKAGGEIDLGVNWRYPLGNGFSTNVRVSLRYRDEIFEAYGMVYDPKGGREIIIASSGNLKEVYKEAIAAGPTFSAMAYRERKEIKKRRLLSAEQLSLNYCIIQGQNKQLNTEKERRGIER